MAKTAAKPLKTVREGSCSSAAAAGERATSEWRGTGVGSQPKSLRSVGSVDNDQHDRKESSKKVGMWRYSSRQDATSGAKRRMR